MDFLIARNMFATEVFQFLRDRDAKTVAQSCKVHLEELQTVTMFARDTSSVETRQLSAHINNLVEQMTTRNLNA